MPEALEDELFYFGLLEEETHYEVVNIIVFDKPPFLYRCELLQSVNLCDYCDHELSELLNLHYDVIDGLHWLAGDVFDELKVNRLEEPSEGVLLKHIDPPEEEGEGLGVLSYVDFFLVEDVNLLNERLVLLKILTKRSGISLVFYLLVFLLSQVPLVLQNQT